MITKNFLFCDVKASTNGTFTGMASVYGNRDLGGDVVERGAFTKTLLERGAHVPILWQHNQSEPIGLGVLADSPGGLSIAGQLDLEVAEARRAYNGLMKGYLRGLSIGYDVIKQRYADGARRLTELKLYEVSIVTFPMNEAATVSSVKRADDDIDALAEMMRDHHRRLAAACGRPAHRSMKEAGDAISANMRRISDLLGGHS